MIGEGGGLRPVLYAVNLVFRVVCLLVRVLPATVFCHLFSILYFCAKLGESYLLSVSFWGEARIYLPPLDIYNHSYVERI